MPFLRILAAALSIGLAGGAQAQTVLVPSGDSAITQPGGTEGRGARRNIREAVRNGDVVGVPAGTHSSEIEARLLHHHRARPHRAE
ncbi:hypothetical protein SAMN05216360_10729 [Methylobacterium phyllostachyos]|uniref:Uncharacterized protein n=1 Tax=Methylobacterium phyllostachyos TaxID=582672 RepID=A0A1H0A2I6_9HYPH|nr:hypothetical protein [Methylobacterium phyllostachyos]SDN27173.1 hypothetical protein SAMN05216360_10729 [Methylobacterium phyllostachyos]